MVDVDFAREFIKFMEAEPGTEPLPETKEGEAVDAVFDLALIGARHVLAEWHEQASRVTAAEILEYRSSKCRHERRSPAPALGPMFSTCDDCKLTLHLEELRG